MDPVTHVLIGGVSARTCGVQRRRLWIMALLGAAPDLDFATHLFGPWAYYIYHHGFFHSMVGILVQGLFWAWLLKKWDPGPFRIRLAHYLIPLFLHLIGDFLTIYGVPLFAPFTFKLYSADLTGSVVLVPLIVMAFFFVMESGRDRWIRRKAVWVWIFWGIYLVGAGGTKLMALNAVDGKKETKTALPSLVNPFQWWVIREDFARREYERWQVDVFRGRAALSGTVSMPKKSDPIVFSQRSAKVKNMINQTRWPVARAKKQRMGWDVEWGNLSFSTLGQVRKRVHVDVSDTGEVLRDAHALEFWKEPL